MRRGLAALCLVGLVAACGGGGDDGGDDVATDIALEPILDVDPCGLLGEDDAADLTGGDVERDDAVGGSLGSAIGCSYRFRGDQGEVTGGAIAASLRVDEDVEDADAALEDAASAGESEDVDLGDGGVVVTAPEQVEVVYVVETVVVSLVVAPVDGEIDDAFVTEVVDFAETTVEPITEAVAEKADREGGEAGNSDATTTTAAPDRDEVRQEEIAGLWTGDWGTMAIQEVDGQVVAAYTHDDGRITGTFEDGVFTGWWTETPTRDVPSDAGDVIFEFAKTDDGSIALDGRWRYGNEGEFRDDWDLTLSEEQVPDDLLAAFENEAEFVEAP